MDASYCMLRHPFSHLCDHSQTSKIISIVFLLISKSWKLWKAQNVKSNPYFQQFEQLEGRRWSGNGTFTVVTAIITFSFVQMEG